jgi:hypothetical protein
MRDDFYCSLLAYEPTTKQLIVGLGNTAHSWTDPNVVSIVDQSADADGWLTSLACSSAEGQRALLAIGRHNGRVTIKCLLDPAVARFTVVLDAPVVCLA